MTSFFCLSCAYFSCYQQITFVFKAVFRIWIHWFRIRIRIQGFGDQKFKQMQKIHSWKKNLLLFWSKL